MKNNFWPRRTFNPLKVKGGDGTLSQSVLYENLFHICNLSAWLMCWRLKHWKFYGSSVQYDSFFPVTEKAKCVFSLLSSFWLTTNVLFYIMVLFFKMTHDVLKMLSYFPIDTFNDFRDALFLFLIALQLVMACRMWTLNFLLSVI